MPNDTFILFTDSSCDLPPEYLEENGIPALQLYVNMDGKTIRCNEISPEDFYDRIRAGAMPTTSQVNVEDALAAFEPVLQQGKDIFYLAFSSGLSGTYNSGEVAAQELRPKYPQRKIIVVDSLCASMGQGLLLHKILELKNQGKTIEEIKGWSLDNRLKLIHSVVVEDLMHLHRGGRVSKSSAVLGSVLGIKPIIRVDDAGKLEVVDKVRGRKPSIARGVERMDIGENRGDICFISHSDCLEDAQHAGELMKRHYGVAEIRYNYVGPVIGSHTGVGTIAIFLMGQSR